MGKTTISKSSKSAAFRIAIGVLCAEKEIQRKHVIEATGIPEARLRNLTSQNLIATDEEIDQIDSAYPGFKQVYEDYVNGVRGWGISRVTQLRDAAGAVAEANNAEARFWREKFLATNEELKDVLKEKAKKDV